ncbi:MAG: hypothetical protein JWQ64_2368 [Subtercola sp.]|nr:hypothetical protein [Subtercola sp.]
MLSHLIAVLPETVTPSFAEGVTVSLSAVLATIVLVSFALSGALKLGRVDQTLESFTALRVAPVLRRRMIAAAVPVAELLLALGLLLAPAPFFSVFCLASAALLGYYLVLVVRVMGRHEQADCRCFGSLSGSRVTGWSVARNAVLFAAALIVLFTSQCGVLPALGEFTAAMTIGFLIALLVLLTALLARAAVRLSRLSSRASATDDGPRPDGAPRFDGTPWAIPDIEVTTIGGDAIALASVAQLRPTLVYLLSAECTPCRKIMERIPGWRDELGSAVDIVIVTSETRGTAERLFGPLTVPVYFGYRALLTVTGVAGVPSALLLTPDRMVAAGPAEGFDEVVAMTTAIVSATSQSVQKMSTQRPSMQKPSIQPRV